MNPQTFFLEESIRHARRMSYCDCLSYLEGLLVTVGNNDDVLPIREAVAAIRRSDQQLELIASGQLRLNLEESNA